MKNNFGKKALLIGNGINRAISNGVKSWENLLEEISETFNIEVDLKNEFKPFPLTFEEILFKSKGDFDSTLNEIKNKIAKVFANTPSNILHNNFVNSGVEDILTTNYDYAFEKALVHDFKNEKEYSTKGTDETLNSIKRKTKFKEQIVKKYSLPENINIWHIHGEINQRISPSKLEKTSRANSIMIGYEHYGAYLAEIQKYIKGEKEKNILEKVVDDNYKPQSWIDFFFMSELHIAGISYDFSEQHLWWLLNYRAKQIKRKKIEEENNIFYYYSVTPDTDPGDLNVYAKQLTKKKVNKAKIDLFSSLGVKTIPIEIKIDDYESYFKQTLNFVGT